MYTRAFTRAEAEAQQPAMPATPPPIPVVTQSIDPRPSGPARHVRPRRPQMASRPLELRAAVTMAAVLVLAGVLAPLAISNGHDDPESMPAADPAVQGAPLRDIELPPQEFAATTARNAAVPASPARTRSPEPRARGRADGGLLVESQPAGARVTVNGIGYGETPLRIGYLPFGTKRVRIIKEGYASAERTVRVDAASPRPRVRITLREQE